LKQTNFLMAIAICFVITLGSCKQAADEQNAVQPVESSAVVAERGSVGTNSTTATLTLNLGASSGNWYYQFAALSDAAMTANGVSTSTMTKEYCQNKGCLAACAMMGISLRQNYTVGASNFVSWCKRLSITNGLSGNINTLQTKLSDWYGATAQSAVQGFTVRNDAKDYLKAALQAGRPIVCRVRYTAPYPTTTMTGTVDHFVLVVGLTLANTSATSGNGDTGSLVRLLDSGTQQQGTSRITEMNYTTFLDAMLSASTTANGQTKANKFTMLKIN
jgi:Peptidase_C39 like family